MFPHAAIILNRMHLKKHFVLLLGVESDDSLKKCLFHSGVAEVKVNAFKFQKKVKSYNGFVVQETNRNDLQLKKSVSIH